MFTVRGFTRGKELGQKLTLLKGEQGFEKGSLIDHYIFYQYNFVFDSTYREENKNPQQPITKH